MLKAWAVRSFLVSGALATHMLPCFMQISFLIQNPDAGYDMEDGDDFPTEPHATDVPPAVAGNYNSASNSQSSVAPPYYLGHISNLTFVGLLIILILLSYTIL